MIRVCEPSLSDLESKYVAEALDHNWLSSVAPPVALFEELFAKRFAAKHGVAVNSGGSALFLALWTLGTREGDEVIVPTFTMVATAGAVTQCGATPVFVDCEPDTANIDVTKIEEKITPQTRGILPVHIYGHPCDMDSIRTLARDYRLFVVEDAAESHGALYRGRPVGTFGDAGCFSFYANKLMTTGEGGIILTDDDKLATALRHCRAYDFDDTRHFWHKRLAWNLRMSSLEAALGRAQLERLDELIAARQRNYAYYCERLGDLVEFLAQKSYATSVSWMCGLLTRDLEERDGLMAFLERNQIETRTFFFPMHQQPVYKSREAFPVAEDLSRRGLYLPSSSHLTEEQLDLIVRSVRAYLEPRRRTGL
jgi:perosamine synthetase